MSINIDQLSPELQKQLVPDSGVVKELKALHTPGGHTIRKIIDYSELGLNVPPVTGRRGGERRLWLPSTGSDHDASARLVSQLPRNKVVEVRWLALILWISEDSRELMPHEPEFRGKIQYETFVLFWLRVYCANLKALHGHILRSDRLDYFLKERKSLETLVWGLTHGFFEGYRVDSSGKLIRPKGREIPDPEKSMKDFGGARGDPVAPILAAKARD